MAPGERSSALRAQGEHFFGWTPFVPFGKVTATYKIGDEVHEATGRGYHDHNWTNTEIGHLIDHWWWARGEVGPYTFLAAHIVAGEVRLHAVPLVHAGPRRQGHRGRRLQDDLHDARRRDQREDRKARAGFDQLRLSGRGHAIRATLTRQKTFVAYKRIDFAKGWEKELVELIRYPGGYLRFWRSRGWTATRAKSASNTTRRAGRSSRSSTSARSTRSRWSATWAASSAAIVGNRRASSESSERRNDGSSRRTGPSGRRPR